MKRWMAALAILLGSSSSLVRADYLILVVNLAASNVEGSGSSDKPNKAGGAGPQAPPVGTPPPAAAAGALPGAAGPAGAAGGLPGAAGGLPGAAAPGKPGVGVQIQGGAHPAEDDEVTPFYVTVVVEVNRTNVKTKLGVPKIEHKWGSAYIMQRPPFIAWSIDNKVVSVPNQFKARREKMAKDRDPPSAEKLFEFAEWVVTHGLIKEFPAIMDDLAKAKTNNPAITQALAAYRKVKADLDKKLTKDDGSSAWKNKGYKVALSDHYALLYDAPGHEPIDVVRRRDRLEETFHAFYYWFALRGKALPTPDRRLVAMLVDMPEEFRRRKTAYDAHHIVADGFYAPRDNVAFFSAKPLDDAYDTLNKITRSWALGGWKFDDLIKGKWAVSKDATQQVENQMLALVLKALEEESAVTSVSHEGIRQLIAGSGLLPRNVEAPEWIQFGMASFFETPRGAPWEGYGAPSWNYLREFQNLEEKRKLDTSEVALENVVTDRYFRAAELGKSKALFLKARTMSWALTYYLAQKRLDNLLNYYQELSNLPRDLALDDEILWACFARAFNLMKGDTVDRGELQKLAKDWYQFIHYTSLEIDLKVNQKVDELIKAQQQQNRNGPNGQPAPGGLPGAAR